MYSGLELTKYSGSLLGAHQKIDRVARRHLRELLPIDASFPKIKEILNFEGRGGPDGVKVKSPAQDEPWHYLNPLGHDAEHYKEIIDLHFQSLIKELKAKNQEKAAFEAAWLAHALVDGLTPAHHYPYEEKITELRGGKGIETRTNYAEKLIYKGDKFSKTIVNNYKVYGPKGIMTTHVLFEWGFSLIIKPLQLPDARPTAKDIEVASTKGPSEYFKQHSREIAVLDIYEKYIDHGWTNRLANQIRHQLAPIMVNTVTVIWYIAAKEAGLCE